MSKFRRIYPGDGQILFDGGKNSKFERSIIADNESPDCANVVFTNGAVQTRQGAVKLNTTAIGTFIIDGLYTRRGSDRSETMVAWANGTAWQLGTTTFTTIPSGQSVFTAGTRVGADEAENCIFFGNGGSIPYKYDGTNFTRHGVYPPTTTSTVASQSAGGLTGDYRYKVTFRNSALVESDVGPVTATFTAAGAVLRITSIPTAAQSWGIGARRLYRTEAGGATFKLVTTVADNSTTTYDDSTADAGLGAAAPTDNGVPPKYSFIIFHQNRLFMNDPDNPNYVWYSELGQPYTVASSNFFKFGDKTSDLVSGFGIFDNALVVKGEKSNMVVYMPDTDPSGWSYVVTKSPYGCKSPYAILNYNNRLLFPATQSGGKFLGFAAFTGNTVEPSTTFLSVLTAGAETKSDRIEPDMFQVNESYLSGISGIVYKNRAYVSVPYGSSATGNNRIYVMDFSLENMNRPQKEAWVPWTGLSANQFTIYGGNLYYGSSTATGFVYKLESGVYSDDGTAIDSYFWTKEFTGGKSDRNTTKDFRYANLLLEKSGDWYMDVFWRVNSDKGVGDSQQIDLDPGSSLWGTMVWGRDAWGGGTDQENYRLFLGATRGDRIQFKFTNRNTVGSWFKVHWMNFVYNLKGDR